MNKAIWYLRQLFPLKYESIYRENGIKKISIWKMYMGRCFDIRTYELKEI